MSESARNESKGARSTQRKSRDAKGRQRPGARARHAGHRSTQKPSQRRRFGDPARKAAYLLLRAIDAGAYANLEMPRILEKLRLTGRDAAFATELGFGAVRWAKQYDRIVAVASGRGEQDIDPVVRDALRLGAHQMLRMRVPDHAATSETVALVRSQIGAGAAGFTNAIVRKVGEHSLEEWTQMLTADLPEDAALAFTTSHPEWIIRALRASLKANGVISAELPQQLRKLLDLDNEPPAVNLVARPGLCTVAELCETQAEPLPISPYAAVLPYGDPGRIAAIRETRAAVQDAGSQLVAQALALAPISGKDERWLDMCAGPGGKAALLACLAAEQGAELYCNEQTPHRSELVNRTLAAAIDTGITVYIGTGDGREIGSEEPDTYDRVLVDAPCTGLGALRRRPEARWRRRPGDVTELVDTQMALLNSAIDAVRPGGVVGYATCSPHPAETVQVVQEMISTRTDIALEDARPLFLNAEGSQIPDIGAGPSVQLWPHLHGTDAMFFALLRKKVVSQ